MIVDQRGIGHERLLAGGDGDVEGMPFALAYPDAFIGAHMDEVFAGLLGGDLSRAWFDLDFQRVAGFGHIQAVVGAGVALVFDVEVKRATGTVLDGVGLNGDDELIVDELIG